MFAQVCPEEDQSKKKQKKCSAFALSAEVAGGSEAASTSAGPSASVSKASSVASAPSSRASSPPAASLSSPAQLTTLVGPKLAAARTTKVARKGQKDVAPMSTVAASLAAESRDRSRSPPGSDKKREKEAPINPYVCRRSTCETNYQVLLSFRSKVFLIIVLIGILPIFGCPQCSAVSPILKQGSPDVCQSTFPSKSFSVTNGNTVVANASVFSIMHCFDGNPQGDGEWSELDKKGKPTVDACKDCYIIWGKGFSEISWSQCADLCNKSDSYNAKFQRAGQILAGEDAPDFLPEGVFREMGTRIEVSRTYGGLSVGQFADVFPRFNDKQVNTRHPKDAQLKIRDLPSIGTDNRTRGVLYLKDPHLEYKVITEYGYKAQAAPLMLGSNLHKDQAKNQMNFVSNNDKDHAAFLAMAAHAGTLEDTILNQHPTTLCRIFQGSSSVFLGPWLSCGSTFIFLAVSTYYIGNTAQ